jgi:flagellum-specific peptidoglycan hydrolase FlgJ
MLDFINIDRRKFRLWCATKKTQARVWTKRSAWKIVFLFAILCLAKQQKIHLSVGDWQLLTRTETTKNGSGSRVQKAGFGDGGETIRALLADEHEGKLPKAVTVTRKATEKAADKFTIKGGKDENLSNTYSNVSFWGGRNDSDAKRAAKRAKQEQYVKKYLSMAQAEMQKFGIPASVTLAQGLVESNAGESTLARKNNNHFGIKCFSRSCSKGHCSNHTDDSHKDFFRVFESPWMSFRTHSLMLKTGHYNRLFRFAKEDYRNWARGLKALGYATDPHYAESLINTIEDLKLYEYDK